MKHREEKLTKYLLGKKRNGIKAKITEIEENRKNPKKFFKNSKQIKKEYTYAMRKKNTTKQQE